ncbi:MAG: hypothetical protein ACRD6W_09515, partial [Nitrososphaerales archaeon]
AAGRANPSSNIAPCSSTWVVAINCARAHEGIGPLPVDLQALETMSVPEQLFALTDYERVARGLPPFSAMTSRLDATAQIGAVHAVDPPLVAVPASSWAGGVWSGGIPSALGAMYEWMYQDGFTAVHGINVDCPVSGAPGCWGHRDNILHPALTCSKRSPSLTVGAAEDRAVANDSIAMTLLISCSGTPGTVTYTWSQAQAAATGRARAASRAAGRAG